MTDGRKLTTDETVRALGDWSSGGGSLGRGLAAALRAAIESGLLAPGARLPPERALASALAVSRSTLVQALDRLRGDGLLRSRQGSGTVIAAGAPAPTIGAEPRVLAQLLGVERGIDLAAATPVDAASLAAIAIDVDALRGVSPSHGYGPRGLLTLRTLIAARHVRQGLPTATEQIQVTNGAQHALHLALTGLVAPGDTVVVEDPTYPGVLDVLTDAGARPRPVRRSADGVDIGELTRALDEGAALAYLMPQLHAPTGTGGDPASVRRLAAYLDAWGGTVVEDAALADLRFDGRRAPSLAAACTRATVVTVETLSKSVWGGLRLGWLRGPSELLDRLAGMRHPSDLGTSIPSQVIGAAVLDRLEHQLPARRAQLAGRAARALALLNERLPEWDPVEPDGGLTLWIRLPVDDTVAFVQRAQRHGVFVAPGSAATAGEAPSAHVRLTFDRTDAQLDAGIERLAATWASG